jgi:hypothetical protein
MIDVQHDERLLTQRSGTLLEAAEAETDSELQAALLAQCMKLQGRAIRLQMERKEAALE